MTVTDEQRRHSYTPPYSQAEKQQYEALCRSLRCKAWERLQQCAARQNKHLDPSLSNWLCKVPTTLR